MLGVLFRVKRVFPTNYADFMKKLTPPPLPLLHGSSSTLTQTYGEILEHLEDGAGLNPIVIDEETDFNSPFWLDLARRLKDE